MPLRQRLTDLDANISKLDLMSCPILTFPPEITAEVFKLCCTDLQHGFNVHPSEAPLLLTQICGDWRALAFSTPALWDTISGIGSDRDPRAEGFVDMWFSRAGTRPLSLGISCTYSHPSQVERDLAYLGSVILQHASRLQNLHVTTYPEVLYKIVTAVHTFPILRKLVLYCLEDDFYNGGDIEILGAPALRHLSLDYVEPSKVIMPWAQLETMTLSHVPLGECLQALRWSTALREFRLEGTPDSDPIEGDFTSPVHHCSLKSLAFSHSTGIIVPLLTLPCLQSFELGDEYELRDYGTYMDADIATFLSRVSNTLLAFKVTLTRPSTVSVHWFHPLTRLTTLELVRPNPLIRLTTLELVRPTGLPFETDVICALNRRALPDFLPKLRSFVMSNCGQVDDGLLDALDSRCHAVDAAHVRLESFSLIWFDDTQDVRLPLFDVLLNRLRALAGQGMHIHIGTPDHNSFY